MSEVATTLTAITTRIRVILPRLLLLPTNKLCYAAINPYLPTYHLLILISSNPLAYALDSVIITYEQLEALRRLADRTYPHEACALLAGSIEVDVDRSSSTYRVRQVIEVDNVDRSSVSFSIGEDDLLRAYDLMSSNGLELVGIFHTHPFSNAYPSGKDLKYMQINPVPWIILGGEGDMRAFITDEGKGVKELRLLLVSAG